MLNYAELFLIVLTVSYSVLSKAFTVDRFHYIQL